jgi:hypothetical protein
MKSLFNLRKRVFLNPISTGHTSYILAEAESSSVMFLKFY